MTVFALPLSALLSAFVFDVYFDNIPEFWGECETRHHLVFFFSSLLLFLGIVMKLSLSGSPQSIARTLSSCSNIYNA
jgi:hypothetical protein